MRKRERDLLEQVLQEIRELREQLERPHVSVPYVSYHVSVPYVSYGASGHMGNVITWTTSTSTGGDESGDAGVRETRRDPPPQGPTDVALEP